MELTTSRLSQLTSLLRDKLTQFYILAFTPLLLIFYYNLWSLVIAFYGFIFLLLKSQRLHSFRNASTNQRILGFIIVIGSFFVYHAIVLIVPTAGFYGGANYIIFLLGLFLAFFDLSALKEAFTPVFFIAAGNSSNWVAELLKPYFTPYLDDITYLIVNILRTLGVNAYMFFAGNNTPIIGFNSLSGNLVLAAFVYECVGVFGALVFSIILVIVLFEDSSNLKTRTIAAIVGISGTFALNILRVTIILLTDYFYGTEAGADVHYVIGYALFSVWLGLFLYVYYKRKTIQNKIQIFFRRFNLTER